MFLRYFFWALITNASLVLILFSFRRRLGLSHKGLKFWVGLTFILTLLFPLARSILTWGAALVALIFLAAGGLAWLILKDQGQIDYLPQEETLVAPLIAATLESIGGDLDDVTEGDESRVEKLGEKLAEEPKELADELGVEKDELSVEKLEDAPDAGELEDQSSTEALEKALSVEEPEIEEPEIEEPEIEEPEIEAVQVLGLDNFIDYAFEARSRGQLEEAIQFFEKARDLSNNAELELLLTLEISYAYRDQGRYLKAEEGLACFIKNQSREKSGMLYREIKNQMLYLEIIQYELNVLGKPNLPYKAIPRQNKDKIEKAFTLIKL